MHLLNCKDKPKGGKKKKGSTPELVIPDLQRLVHRQEWALLKLWRLFPFQYLGQQVSRSTRWRGPGPEMALALIFQSWFSHQLSCWCPPPGFWCSSPRSRVWSSLQCNPSHTHTLHSARIGAMPEEHNSQSTWDNSDCYFLINTNHCWWNSLSHIGTTFLPFKPFRFFLLSVRVDLSQSWHSAVFFRE